MLSRQTPSPPPSPRIYSCNCLFPGKYEEALEVLRKALAIQRKTIGPHDETVMTSQEIGKVLEILGRKEEAEEAAKFSKKLIDDKKRIDKAMEDLKI